jgi:hypothetical protein
MLADIRKPSDEAATFYSGLASGNRALQYGPRKTAAELAISGAGLNPELDPQFEQEHPYRAAIERPLVGILATALTDPMLIAGIKKGISPTAAMADRGLAAAGGVMGGASALESGTGAAKEIYQHGMNPRALELLINAGLGAGFGYLGYRGARGPSPHEVVPELVPEDTNSNIGFSKRYDEVVSRLSPILYPCEIDNLIKQGPASSRNVEPQPEVNLS